MRSVRRARWRPGAVIAARLRDGRVYSARLLEYPWVAFYDGHDEQLPKDLQDVVDRPVLRTLAVNDNLLREGWTMIGVVPLDGSLHPPARRFVQALDDPDKLRVIEADDTIRPATFDEVRGLERAAVWAPEHIEDMLVAHTRGEVDEHTLALAPVKPDDGNGTDHRSTP